MKSDNTLLEVRDRFALADKIQSAESHRRKT